VVSFSSTPAISNNTVSTSQSFCGASFQPNQLTGTQPQGGTGAYSYQWQQSADNGISWSVVSSSTAVLGYAPPALSQTFVYRRRVLSDACDNFSNNLTITVSPTPTAFAGGSAIFRCDNNPLAPIFMTGATAYSVFTTDTASAHQVWYRISGGDALFRQRLRVYQENAGPRPQNQLPPDSARRQELLSNDPTGWLMFPAATGISSYYFDGDHRSRGSEEWEDALGLKVRRTRYANGNLYELGFEDQESLDDFNDLEIQVVFLQALP
jgi:hypothetical protein